MKGEWRHKTNVANPLLDWLKNLNIRTRVTALEEHMATLDETITAIDTETTRIGTNITDVAADLDTLRGELAGRDQATADRLAQIGARLTAESDRLQVIASDPANPVPPLEPTPGP